MKLCPNCFSAKSMKQGTCAICGFRSTVARDKRALPAGILLNNRYIVGRVLGMGGFGITYIAYDNEAGERLAIKEYFPAEWAMRLEKQMTIVPNSQNLDELYTHGQEVFLNEAKILHKLGNVPHVINIKDFFSEHGTSYIVMDFLDGFTLNNYIKRTGKKRMNYQSALEIVKVAGQALHQVHKHMLLHRDVGPDNIMITKNKEIYLIDFGATRMYALNSPKSMSVLVKPGFAPIEQYSRAGNQGPWTDVYALTATFYYLLTGKKPPEAPDRITGAQVIPLKELAPEVPDRVCQAVEGGLSEDWRNRPQSMHDLLDELGLLGNQDFSSRTIWYTNAIQATSATVVPRQNVMRPCVLLQVGGTRTRYYFMQDNTLTVGRTDSKSNLVLNDSQVSGVHFKLWYDAIGRRFTVENYSSNRTYTSNRMLEKNQSTVLLWGEWLYIQTSRARYIFYLEVE